MTLFLFLSTSASHISFVFDNHVFYLIFYFYFVFLLLLLLLLHSNRIPQTLPSVTCNDRALKDGRKDTSFFFSFDSMEETLQFESILYTIQDE